MRVLLTYGVLMPGGCERRMGDIVRWLIDHGDEAWIAANIPRFDGVRLLVEQCGVPLDRMFFFEDNGGAIRASSMSIWINKIAKRVKADVVDVQWHPGYEQIEYPCPAVATLHGIVGAPPPSIFQGVVAVEDRLVNGSHYKHGAAVVWNWVNLRRFPFREELGEGICSAGREFKGINVRKVLLHYDKVIDGYGTPAEPDQEWPITYHWHGFQDLAEVFPRYRVVLASAQTAMEAMAAGRLVIAGQTPHVNMASVKPAGFLVVPANVETLAQQSFAYCEEEPSALEVWLDCKHALEHDMLEERRALRAWVEERHNIDTQIAQIREYYEEVAG